MQCHSADSKSVQNGLPFAWDASNTIKFVFFNSDQFFKHFFFLPDGTISALMKKIEPERTLYIISGA